MTSNTTKKLIENTLDNKIEILKTYLSRKTCGKILVKGDVVVFCQDCCVLKI